MQKITIGIVDDDQQAQDIKDKLVLNAEMSGMFEKGLGMTQNTY